MYRGSLSCTSEPCADSPHGSWLQEGRWTSPLQTRAHSTRREKIHFSNSPSPPELQGFPWGQDLQRGHLAFGAIRPCKHLQGWASPPAIRATAHLSWRYLSCEPLILCLPGQWPSFSLVHPIREGTSVRTSVDSNPKNAVLEPCWGIGEALRPSLFWGLASSPETALPRKWSQNTGPHTPLDS